MPVDNYVYYLCYNATNNKVYCASAVSDNVAVIDGATNGVVTTIAVGASPQAFTWNPAQNRVYAANRNGNSVSVIRDSTTTGVEEIRNAEAQTPNAATLVRGALMLGAADSRQNPRHRTALHDAAGRKVADLRPGANDVGSLAPGVYFVRELQDDNGRPHTGIRKVILTR